MKNFVAVLFFLLLSAGIYAQDTTGVEEVATGLRSNGKIYVVLAVVVTILLGLILYLVSLDRKISRLEKQNP